MLCTSIKLLVRPSKYPVTGDINRVSLRQESVPGLEIRSYSHIRDRILGRPRVCMRSIQLWFLQRVIIDFSALAVSRARTG